MFITSLAGTAVALVVLFVVEVLLDLLCDWLRVAARRRPFVRLAFGAVLLATCLSSCVTTSRGPVAMRSATPLSDSTLAALDYFLPDPVDSAAPRVDVPRSALREFFAPSTAKKDKRQLHVTVYNAPATVKGGSQVVVGNGNTTADNRKAAAPAATGDAAAAVDNTKAGQKGGAAATAPGATATAPPQVDAGGLRMPWWLLLVALGAGWLSGRCRWPL